MHPDCPDSASGTLFLYWEKSIAFKLKRIVASALDRNFLPIGKVRYFFVFIPASLPVAVQSIICAVN